MNLYEGIVRELATLGGTPALSGRGRTGSEARSGTGKIGSDSGGGREILCPKISGVLYIKSGDRPLGERCEVQFCLNGSAEFVPKNVRPCLRILINVLCHEDSNSRAFIP
jgi:hypothetical protein